MGGKYGRLWRVLLHLTFWFVIILSVREKWEKFETRLMWETWLTTSTVGLQYIWKLFLTFLCADKIPCSIRAYLPYKMCQGVLLSPPMFWSWLLTSYNEVLWLCIHTSAWFLNINYTLHEVMISETRRQKNNRPWK